LGVDVEEIPPLLVKGFFDMLIPPLFLKLLLTPVEEVSPFLEDVSSFSSPLLALFRGCGTVLENVVADERS
jgi:hypothetical protein